MSAREERVTAALRLTAKLHEIYESTSASIPGAAASRPSIVDPDAKLEQREVSALCARLAERGDP